MNANDYKVAEVLLKFSAKGRHTLPGSIDFFHNCTNLQKFTQLIMSKADFGGLFPGKKYMKSWF